MALDLPIFTKRLIIRAPADRDLEALNELYTDPIALEHMGTRKVWTQERIQCFHDQRMESLHTHGYTAYTLEIKDGGPVIGFFGFMPDENQKPEGTVAIIRRHWLGNYMQEAIGALREPFAQDPDLAGAVISFEASLPGAAAYHELITSCGFAFDHEAPHPTSGRLMRHYKKTTSSITHNQP
ncbi:GNAT family N-acetyltransferase [Actinomadura sp. WAC 06369]|uniref:GNAT family N-acetyltransferase n=1 Tax=Actinomadura sp. WAC 06369 TaxID=2203193 RepID=UPI000F7AC757|nr:GNAT family protein [Actinomadura sp. WAC 06369]RSN66646.1 hypothetical protein DMH08_15820 [Actinomadura sp. WAC 06369]